MVGVFQQPVKLSGAKGRRNRGRYALVPVRQAPGPEGGKA
jgi:hypothetical protein